MSEDKFPSELRFDVASEDWVVIATGRAKRPDTFKKEDRDIGRTAPEDCPFCDLKDQEKPTLVMREGEKVSPGADGFAPKDWTTVSIPNKFPAFIPEGEAKQEQEGKLYIRMNAVGHHELVITRDHDDPLGLFSQSRAKELMDVYHQRYLSLMDDGIVKYISIFQNHGPEAGASVYHPHSQLITTPLIDTDLRSALQNSREFHEKKKDCVYCQMIKWERKVRKRVVFENKHFLVICPFASKVAFEVIITPKEHAPNFHEITEEEKNELGEAFREALSRLYKGLNNPSYNFYLHSAPVDGSQYPFYHWHWTILPKTGTFAGFELGAEMEISVIEPERAAQYLRKQ